MAGQTTNYKLPYPVSSDTPDGAAQMLALATAVDGHLLGSAGVRGWGGNLSTYTTTASLADATTVAITIPATWLTASLFLHAGCSVPVAASISHELKYSATAGLGTQTLMHGSLSTGYVKSWVPADGYGLVIAYRLGGGAGTVCSNLWLWVMAVRMT